MGQASISFADLYGATPPGRAPGNTQPTDTEQASGRAGGVSGNSPAYFWLGMVAMLFIARFLWEKGR